MKKEFIWTDELVEESKQDWKPAQGEEVWVKIFSNWSKGIYIGYDIIKNVHLVREDKEGGGNLLSSSKILPYYSMPNEPKQDRTCTHNCSVVCGECQILEHKQETPEHNSKFIVFTYQNSEDWTQHSILLDSFQKADEFAQQFRDKKISYLICKTVKQGYNGK